MQEVKQPTWEDLGYNKEAMSYYLSQLQLNEIDGLINYHLLQLMPKFYCRYSCKICGNTKDTNKFYDSYSSCQNCGGKQISVVFENKPQKNFVNMFSNNMMLNNNNNLTYEYEIIKLMALLYSIYFDQPVDRDFFQVQLFQDGTSLGGSLTSNLESNLKIDLNKNHLSDSFSVLYMVSFAGNKGLISPSFTHAAALGALSCPFVWDKQAFAKKGNVNYSHDYLSAQLTTQHPEGSSLSNLLSGLVKSRLIDLSSLQEDKLLQKDKSPKKRNSKKIPSSSTFFTLK